jgi:transaldolase/glucose-6-phosphate isomerase
LKQATSNLKLQVHLGPYRDRIEAALKEAAEQRVMSRLRAHDHTLWKPEPKDIVNRLGWLDAAEKMRSRVEELEAFAGEMRREGYRQALLMGMGGSSLATEVIRKIFGVREGFLDLAVLDSTDPGAVLRRAGSLDMERTLFIVSTKSGDTVETLSFFKYFFSRAIRASGISTAGRHFIAITDPGSPLAEKSSQCGFRRTFLNDPTIGGRYSALSLFGLVPAALIGLDLRTLLDRVKLLTGKEGDVAGEKLGVILGELALAGRDKLTLFTSPALPGLGGWVEQLIAESTGKEGRGILPIVGESPGEPGVYGDDRLFVAISLRGESIFDQSLQALDAAGHPVIRLRLDDPRDLGAQFLLWEIATAVAGWRLRINPFDQPNVEAAKVLARQMVADYLKEGSLPEETPVIEDRGLKVYGNIAAASAEEALSQFLGQASRRNYIALQAFIEPTAKSDALLSTLSAELRDRHGLAVTAGYGPRYLHSTGQLHKGDGGHGLFIQFTADDERDAAIPGDDFSPSAVTFGVLKSAQALGDRKALENTGRRVIRFHLGNDTEKGLERLIQSLR